MYAPRYQRPNPHASRRMPNINVFIDLIKRSDVFTNLLGWSHLTARFAAHLETMYANLKLTNKQRAELVTWYSRDTERKHPSDFWRFDDSQTGGGCIIQIHPNHQKPGMGHIQCIWTPPEFSRQGIARRCFDELKRMATEVDDLSCGDNPQYRGEKLYTNSFTLVLAPNPFHVDTWTLDQSTNTVDWSDPEAATVGAGMIDEVDKELPEEHRRTTWTQLRDFYLSIGFVEVDELGYVEWYNDGSEPGSIGIRESRTMGDRSYEIGRKNMIFPACNASIFKKHVD